MGSTLLSQARPKGDKGMINKEKDYRSEIHGSDLPLLHFACGVRKKVLAFVFICVAFLFLSAYRYIAIEGNEKKREQVNCQIATKKTAEKKTEKMKTQSREIRKKQLRYLLKTKAWGHKTDVVQAINDRINNRNGIDEVIDSENPMNEQQIEHQETIYDRRSHIGRSVVADIYDQEPHNSTWTKSLLNVVDDILQSLEQDMEVEMTSLDCHETICKITFSYPTNEVFKKVMNYKIDMWAPSMGNIEGIEKVYDDGEVETDIYISN